MGVVVHFLTGPTVWLGWLETDPRFSCFFALKGSIPTLHLCQVCIALLE